MGDGLTGGNLAYDGCPSLLLGFLVGRLWLPDQRACSYGIAPTARISEPAEQAAKAGMVLRKTRRGVTCRADFIDFSPLSFDDTCAL